MGRIVTPFSPGLSVPSTRLVPSRLAGSPFDDAFTPASLPGLVGWWPMDEAFGSVSYDKSPEGNNGAYTGVTLGQTGIGDGRTAASLDGSTSFNNIYSAGLAADFNGAEGTLAIWAKVSGAGVWTDATADTAAKLQADAANYIHIRSEGNGDMTLRRIAGGTVKAITVAMTTADWFHAALTWSVSAGANGQIAAYLNGVQTGLTLTNIGTFSGALGATTTNLGADTTVPVRPYNGTLAHALLYRRALPAFEIARLALVATYA